MTPEKRRFFRINDTVGLTYELLDAQGEQSGPETTVDLWSLMSDQDEKIERLLGEVAEESPKVAELVRALNQKLERILGQLMMDNRLVQRLAGHNREVNLSACGVGFVNDRKAASGTRIKLELELLPDKQVVPLQGVLVGCDAMRRGYYWRVNFCAVKPAVQELLIQHVVKRQSAQLQRNK